MNQGKLVIVFIFGLSAVMGAYAWWHHYTQGRRCVELWGAQTGEMIRYAPQVEVLLLDHAAVPDAETIQIQDEPLEIVARKDITQTPGLVHARQALIEDASFLWNADLTGPSEWQYLLRFTDGDKQDSLAFDCGQGRVRLVGSDRQAALQPHLASGYEKRLPEWLGTEASASRTGANSSQPAESAAANKP